MKIATKYLLFVLVPVVTSVAVLSAGLYIRSSRAINEDVDRNLSYTARYLRDLINKEIETVKGDLTIILTNKSLEQYFMYLNIDEMDYVEDARATLEENIVKIAMVKPQYAALMVFRSDGKGLVNITDKRATYTYPDPRKRRWFRSALCLSKGESYTSGVYMCPEHKVPSLFVSQPYFYRGRLRGIGSIHIHVQDFFGKLLSDIEVGRRGYSYLVDSKGIIVAHKYPSRVGTDTSSLESTKGALAGNEGILVERAETGNISMKKSYLPLHEGLGIIVAQPLDEAMAISNRVKRYAVGISTIVTIFLLLLISWVSRKIVIGPIRELSDATKKMFPGDLTETVKGDEIQHLAEVFKLAARSVNDHISSLRQIQERLKDQRQLLQTILDATPDLVCLQDRESVYQAVNTAFCQQISREGKDIVGKTDFDLFPADVARQNREENLKVINTRKPLEREDEVQTPKGKKWFHVVRVPVSDAEGNVVAVLYSGRDITQLKQIQARLIQSQKMESLGQLAACIAHEINTPLGIILGYAQLLLEEVPEGGDMHEGLETIIKQSKICGKIVSSLLTFSRETEATLVPIDMNQCIEEVVRVLEHSFKLDRVTIERDYDYNLPAITGDKDKFKQVFVNLLNNARDAIGTDGTISITTRLDEENSELVISVTDTGRGIPPENIDHVFEPFFTTKAGGEGTGLGLMVTYGIIREHGGRIEVQSPPEAARKEKGEAAQGTVFTIHLPVLEDRRPKNEGEETWDGKSTGFR